MKTLKTQRFGTQAQGIELLGDPAQPEPTHVLIKFPGGEVDVTRTEGDDYWVHVTVNRPGSGQHVEGETVTARITDGRVDAHDKHAGEILAEVIADPEVYHVAVRVTQE